LATSFVGNQREPERAMSDQLRLEVDRGNVALDEPLMTAADAAALLSVRTSWIYDAARSGEAAVRIGKHVRFLRSDLERFVAEQRRGRFERR
jgi:excisionase family DNA binding protein